MNDICANERRLSVAYIRGVCASLRLIGRLCDYKRYSNSVLRRRLDSFARG